MARLPLTGILLVGGQSTRFGSPKADAVLDGETLRERAWRLLDEACDERLAVGPGGLADPATGPVAAIAAGLQAASHDVAVVIPVDMPLLTAAALHALAGACRDAAVGPRGPLPCAVSKSALRAFETGERRLRSVLEAIETAVVELDESLLVNVNEPRDLESVMAEPKKQKDDKHESHGASKQRDHEADPKHPKQKTTDPVKR